MKSRRTIVLGALLVALAVLVLASGCFPLEPKMSYQGRLTNPQGTPLPGSHNVTLRLRGPMPGPGTPTPTVVWSETKNITADDSGLFNTVLGDTTPLNVEDFSQRLFLEVEIGGETLSPRQQLLGAPYALSLVPGAVVVGAITPAPTPRGVLNVWNIGGVGLGAIGDPAILASGDVKQIRTGNGLVKAAVYVNCNDSMMLGAIRSFNNVNTTQFTFSPGPGVGRCTIDFGFDISDRFWVATGVAGLDDGVNCWLGGSNDQLDCFRWDATNGTGSNGNIMVLVY